MRWRASLTTIDTHANIVGHFEWTTEPAVGLNWTRWPIARCVHWESTRQFRESRWTVRSSFDHTCSPARRLLSSLDPLRHRFRRSSDEIDRAPGIPADSVNGVERCQRSRAVRITYVDHAVDGGPRYAHSLIHVRFTLRLSPLEHGCLLGVSKRRRAVGS